MLALPRPAKGETYLYAPTEVITILDLVGSGKVADKSWCAVKKAMLKKKLVGPTTMNCLDKFLHTITITGKIQPIWDQRGHQELVLMDELRVITIKMRANQILQIWGAVISFVETMQ
jgi:hypothetical protein